MRRVSVAVATVLIGCVLAMAGSGVAAAASSYRVSATAGPATALVGTSIAVTGSVRLAAPGARVVLQRYYSGAWHSVKSATLSSTSAYRFRVTAPASPATWSLRVVKPAGRYARGVSPTRTVRVVSTAYRVDVTLTPATRLAGEPFEVRGSVSPAAAGAVSLQRYYSGAWRTLETTTLSSTSQFAFLRAFSSRGSYPLRVVKPFSASVATGASPRIVATVVGTQRVSVGGGGVEGGGDSRASSISADGRYVAFTSSAPNLVPGEANDNTDVFVVDRTTGAVERVSVRAGGEQGNADSFAASISADGRYVAFSSYASNLVTDDTYDKLDVFVKDRLSGALYRVSTDSDGAQANNDSRDPSISADGHHVAFASEASNLAPGDSNQASDVFVKDWVYGTVDRVSESSDGTFALGKSVTPSISANGRYVAFASDARNLVSGDTNLIQDVFVKDRSTRVISRVSISDDGEQGDSHSGTGRPSISADGRYVAFDSWASNLMPGDTNGYIDVFVSDRADGTLSLVSSNSEGVSGNGHSVGWGYDLSISANGRYVAFSSVASNLVPDDTNDKLDVFVKDRATGAVSRTSLRSDGGQSSEDSFFPSMSADGLYLTFSSEDSLVPGDTNGSFDVFVRGR